MQPYVNPNYYRFMNDGIPSLRGRLVASADQIMVGDIPMDGSIAVFPRQDMSEIYIKSWGGDGNIHTVAYRPVTDDSLVNNQANSIRAEFEASQSLTDTLLERFDLLESKMEQLLDKSTTRTRQTAKKESEEK